MRNQLIFVILLLGLVSTSALAVDYRAHTLDEWQRRLLSPDPAVRQEAVGALRFFGAPAVPSLIHSLNDSENRVREAAMWALARIGPDAVPALITKTEDSDNDAAFRAGHALGMIGPPAIPALMTTLRVHRSTGFRRLYPAAFHMSPEGKVAAVPALLELLQDSDNEVRLVAMQFMGHMFPETVAAASAIVKWLGSDRKMQEATMSVLFRLGPKALPALRQGLSNPESEVRKKSLQLIAGMSRPAKEAEADVQRLCTSDPDPGVRYEAAIALGQIIGGRPEIKC